MVIMHVWCSGRTAHSREIAGEFYVRPFFSARVFCFVGTLWKDFGERVLWHLWIGRATKPRPGPQHVAVEVFNVGSLLTHGDLALEVPVDYLAVVEHRLIPARVRSELARLRSKGLAPASQDSSHFGNAGVGVVSMRRALVALPTFVTAQFRRFFDCGRASGCQLPLDGGRFFFELGGAVWSPRC